MARRRRYKILTPGPVGDAPVVRRVMPVAGCGDTPAVCDADTQAHLPLNILVVVGGEYLFLPDFCSASTQILCGTVGVFASLWSGGWWLELWAMVVRVVPTVQQVERARVLYEFGALNNSIMRGGSNVYGALGEVVFGDLCAGWTKVESFDHDFVRADGATVDVKSKRTTVAPRSDWACSVAATSAHQRPDYLVFVRVLENLSLVWLVGWLSRDEFYRRAVFGRKGEPDPDGRDGWVYRADCWNVRAEWLRPVTLPALRCQACGRLPGSGPVSVLAGCVC